MRFANTFNFRAIRAAHPLADYCAQRGIELRRVGKSLQGKCAIHQESNGASFTVWPADGRWRCFGKCNRGGDIIDLIVALADIPAVEAACQLSEALPTTIERKSATVAVSQRIAEKPLAYILSEEDRMRMNAASHALAFDATLCRAIAAARGWNDATIRNLAMDGDLGWEAGRLMFGYSNGIKWRWKENGQRVIRWLVGGPNGQCWRQSLLCSVHHRVVVAEGETDVIALISAGFESDGETLVIGMPSASSLPNPVPFSGREILIFADKDEAGAKAATSLATALYPVAAGVRIADWSALETREAA